VAFDANNTGWWAFHCHRNDEQIGEGDGPSPSPRRGASWRGFALAIIDRFVFDPR
jgi:hypothetical protein